jgi:hypothetical protein
MPLTTQRRNTAYLNGGNSRSGREDRALGGQALQPWTELAIDLGGSVEPCFRPDALSGLCLRLHERSSAAATKRKDRTAPRLNDLCGLTVELSGAAAAV